MDSTSAAPGLSRRQACSGINPVSWQTACMSALLHGAALAAVCLFVVPRHIAEPAPLPGFAVVVAAAPVNERILDEAKLVAATQVMATRLTAPRTISLASTSRGDIDATPRRKVPAVAPASGPAQFAAAAPAQAAAAPAPQGELLGLEARIRQAVQDAAIYPASARAMHREGRTQVRFDYTDGSVGAADVATSSTSPMLDRAAVAAVRRAALPRAPAEIGARTLALLVWVDFRLVRQD